jgi:predicted ribosomally synthesized peptide with nif11-like leader
MNSVEQFFQEVSQDQTLQQQFQSILDGEAILNKAVELGKEKGYTFTPAEVEEWVQNRSQELSDSELDAVAGGGILSGGFGALFGGIVGALRSIDRGIERGNVDWNEVGKDAVEGGAVGGGVGAVIPFV